MKSETSDSFVNHFDGHFAYLKTLDFYFKIFQFINTNFSDCVSKSEERRCAEQIYKNKDHACSMFWKNKLLYFCVCAILSPLWFYSTG